MNELNRKNLQSIPAFFADARTDAHEKMQCANGFVFLFRLQTLNISFAHSIQQFCGSK